MSDSDDSISNLSQIIPNEETINNEEFDLSSAEDDQFESTLIESVNSAVSQSKTQNVPPLEVSLVLFLGISRKDINLADLKFRMN